MIWKEGAVLLQAAGVDVRERRFGLEGSVPGGSGGPFRYTLGGSSGGGCEMSICPPSGAPVRWFQRPSVETIVALLLDAHQLVERGDAASLLDALQRLDPR